MNRIILLFAGWLTLISFLPAHAQRFNRPRPISLQDQIFMKLDSIDMIYFSRFRTKEKFDARRRLDAIAQLVTRMEDQLNEKERALQERERSLLFREKELMEKEREMQMHNMDKDWERNREHNRDLNKDHDKTVFRLNPISPQDFIQLTEAVERTHFDQDKKKIVKTAAINNYFLVDQVVKLVSKFSFDTDKLDVVQILYSHILDLDKKYLLYNCFTFSDSKNKLERFMEENRSRP